MSLDKKIDTLDNDLNKKHDELRSDIKILSMKFNIMITLVSGTFLMMLGLFIQNLIK